MANTWFNEDVYLQNKLTAWRAEAGNADKDLEALKKAIADAGMTPESHFLQFGANEGLSPNEFFVIDEYVANQVVFLNDRDGVTTWTADSFKNAVKAAGMTLWSHYQQYGWAEANPSNSFDAEQYFADKLTALQEDPATAAEWADKNVTDVKDAFAKAGIDPVSHYFAYGKDEGVAVTPVDAQPNTLTEALEDLAAANAAKTAFLEGLELDTDFDGAVDVDAGDALVGDVTGMVDTAATTLSNSPFTTLAKADLLNTDKVALQDADISVAVAAAEKAVTTATNAAPNGATVLLNEVTAQVEAQKALLIAEQKAVDAYNDEVTAFEAVNPTQTIGTAVGNLEVVDGEWGVSDGSGALTAVYAELVSGAWTLTEDGEAVAATIKGYADLLAAYDANEAANDATTAGNVLLEDAVEAVLLAEFDGYSVKDFGNVISGATTPSLTPSVTINYDAGDAVVYDTAADETAANGTAEKFTVTFSSPVADGDAVTFDGFTYTAAGGNGATATGAATAFATAYTATTYTVVDNGDGTLTFTAKAVGDVTVTTASFTGTGSATVTDVSVNVEGVAAGDTTTITSTATDSQELADALADLSDLNEAIANYESSRALNAELTAKETAITEATAAITDPVEDGGLGVNLLASTSTAFTSKDDVLLYVEGTDKTMANFGLSGKDSIFFGAGFKLTEIASDKAITDNVGDAGVLEILWDQQGTNLVLYVEEETFAGNSSAGATADITTITLTGVNAADVSFEGGFLTIA